MVAQGLAVQVAVAVASLLGKPEAQELLAKATQVVMVTVLVVNGIEMAAVAEQEL